MRINNYSKTLLIFFLLVSTVSFAQVNENLRQYQVKKNVEKILLDDMESLIKTKLSEGTFQVNLKVKLKDNIPLENRELASDSGASADPRLKLFDLQKIIDSYKFSESNDNIDGFPEIERVDVLVGLSEFYETNFRNRFQAWFTTMAKERVGDVQVSYSLIGEPIKPDPYKDEKNIEKEKNDEKNKEDLENMKEELQALDRKMQEELSDLNRGMNDKISGLRQDIRDELNRIERKPANVPPKTNFDHFKDLQNLLGWLLFGLLLYMGLVYLSKNLKPMVETRNENINHKEGDQSTDSSSGGGEEISDETMAVSDDMEEMDIMNEPLSPIEHMTLSLAQDQEGKLHELFDFWMEGSMIDKKKFWALISLCFRADVETAINGTVIPQIQKYIANRNIEWSDEAFKSIQEKKTDELASAVYNDLVRMKTFGVESFRVRLSALQGLSGKQIVNLVSQIGDEDILLLFLSSEQKKIYLNSLPESRKAAVLHSSMNMLEVSDHKLTELEGKVNKWLANSKEEEEEKVLSLVGKIKETFGSLTLTQKLKYVGQLKANNLKSYEGLCRSHFNPLWFHNLSDRMIQDVMNLFEYNETLYLASLSEDNKNKILSLSAPRLRRMLEEENLEDQFDMILSQDAKYSGVEDKVISTVTSYLEQKNISIEDAYEFSEEPEAYAA